MFTTVPVKVVPDKLPDMEVVPDVKVMGLPEAGTVVVIVPHLVVLVVPLGVAMLAEFALTPQVPFWAAT